MPRGFDSLATQSGEIPEQSFLVEFGPLIAGVGAAFVAGGFVLNGVCHGVVSLFVRPKETFMQTLPAAIFAAAPFTATALVAGLLALIGGASDGSVHEEVPSG